MVKNLFTNLFNFQKTSTLLKSKFLNRLVPLVSRLHQDLLQSKRFTQIVEEGLLVSFIAIMMLNFLLIKKFKKNASGDYFFRS